jgi:drug/metabolite transporter (DMT)-like permease
VLGRIVINAHSFHRDNSNQRLGDIIILLSLLPEAIYYVLSKMHSNKLPVFLASALMNGLNTPILILFAAMHHDVLPTSISITQYQLLLIVSLGSVLFYVFWFSG